MSSRDLELIFCYFILTHAETGEFGTDMTVNISNIGPTTIMIEK